ncbi:MAG TPA: head GIN domain-containing protein [Allosphingosinicella sp.]|jgi:hypothetical protein
MRNFMILGSVLLLGACNFSADAKEAESPGVQTQRSYQVAGFDRLAVAGPHNVIVTVGGAPSLRAEGDSKQIERLEVKVENGELTIGVKERKGFSWSSNRQALTIYVTAPSLRGAAVAGSGNIKIDRVEGKSFAAAIGGSGNIELPAMKVEEAAFAIGGSGNIKAAGTAGTSDVSIGGSGDLDLAGLEARQAKVSIAGSGNVRARATETADISIVGSGDVELSGGAKCTIDKMGSGSARCTG